MVSAWRKIDEHFSFRGSLIVIPGRHIDGAFVNQPFIVRGFRLVCAVAISCHRVPIDVRANVIACFCVVPALRGPSAVVAQKWKPP